MKQRKQIKQYKKELKHVLFVYKKRINKSGGSISNNIIIG